VSAIRITLSEDHQIVRQGLRALLEAEPDFCIVGEAADGIEAAQLAERLQPDVMVVDLMMPGMNGLEVTRQVSRRSPETRVIILSAFENEAYVAEALGIGAAGYVLKRSSAADLARAVREVAAGRRYLSPALSERAIEAYVRYVEEVKDTTEDPQATLTPREREVLYLVAQGNTTAEIAAQLVISPRTVEVHRANVRRKLGLSSPTDLIRYAMQHGILPIWE
jgi:DNA-binding NarL/FixJ family response regulator